jgi:hypothetical protein
MQRLGNLWNGRRDIELRLLGYAVQNLEFLRYFLGLQRLNVEVPIVRNIDGLRHVADSLKQFALANTTARLSLRPVASCTLPDLSQLARLEEIEIESMKSLRDISAIAKAPALRFLGLWDCKGLTPQSFQCLLGHPALRSLHFGIGRLRDNEAVAAMFPKEMRRSVSYKITPATYLRRPTP